MHPMIDRILTEGVCPAEINLFNARTIIDHVQMHEEGRCTKTGSKGKFHPMTGAEDVEHARVLMVEAPTICECGGH